MNVLRKNLEINVNKLLAVAALSLGIMFAQPALSQSFDCRSLDVSSMTSEQIESAKSFCKAPQTQAAEAAKEITPDKVREWASLGKEFSMAVTDTARGLGMVANEFLFTPVGILLAFYFLWSMIGGVIVGSICFALTWILYLFVCRKLTSHTYEYDYENVPILWGAFTVKKIKASRIKRTADNDSSVYFYMAIPALIVSALLLIVIL